VLYKTAEDAERDGFTACSRCAPGRNAETLAESCVRAAIDYIEACSSQTLTLDTLAEKTGLSANHLQQTFKRMVGLTPKEYHDTRRIDCFKARVRLGESIACASYGAGYGSSRALYEGASQHLGMTPSTYRHGGGVRIRFAWVKGAPGPVLLAGTQVGLCAVLRGASRKMMFRALCLEFPRADFARVDPPPVNWIAAVMSGDREDPFVSRLPFEIRSRIFRARVMRVQR
jgi:AraC family transcriptional regulator of adaptative response/methylated-DNA-[protein]-cysteine methyltransferase